MFRFILPKARETGFYQGGKVQFGYCNSCYDDFNDEIEEYSYKPEPVFYGDGKRYLGVELEMDCGGKDDDNENTYRKITHLNSQYFRLII